MTFYYDFLAATTSWVALSVAPTNKKRTCTYMVAGFGNLHLLSHTISETFYNTLCLPYWLLLSTWCSCGSPSLASHWWWGRWPVPCSSCSGFLWSRGCPTEAPWTWVHMAFWPLRAGDLHGGSWPRWPGPAYRGASSSLWPRLLLQTDSGSLRGSIRETDF